MKKTILLSVAVLLLSVSCSEVTPDVPVVPDEITETVETGSSDLSVVISSENGAAGKATIAETGGTFAFSNGDRIKVFDGTGSYRGSTRSTTNEGLFSVEKPFDNSVGSGWVVFPLDIATSISASAISITLPTSYNFSQVGSADADACKAPVPMIGQYTAGNKVTLKQAASVIRFRFQRSELGAGNISFTFGKNVTGAVTISDPNPGTSYISTPSTSAGKTITVSISDAEWSGVSGEYVYFTIPVPVGTTIDDTSNTILVSFSSVSTSKMTIIKPATGKTLARAEGYKLSGSFSGSIPEFRFQVDGSGKTVVMAPGNLMAHIGSYTYDSTTPYPGGFAEADEWKFGAYMEMIGSGTSAGNYLLGAAGAAGSANATALVGKWVDLFAWQGESATVKKHGLINFCPDKADTNPVTNQVQKWHGNVENENLYSHCWETNADNTAEDGYIQISNGGSYKWRMMSSDEWQYILNERTGSTVGTFVHARHGRATINGVCGLLIFPDGIVWRTTAQGGSDYCGSATLNTQMTAIADAKGVPTNLNINEKNDYNFEITYSNDDFLTMSQCGIVFLPSSGYRNGDSVLYCGTYGYYWSSSGADSSGAKSIYYAKYLIFNNNLVETAYEFMRGRGRCVRLVRDVVE